MLEAAVIISIVIAMYIIIYKYEQRSIHSESVHYNHIYKLWVVFPKVRKHRDVK